jgi:ribonuclease VapC
LIALDSSALIAIGLREPDWEDCFRAISLERSFVMSAVTLTETLVVALHREVLPKMRLYLDALDITIIAADESTALRVVDIYARWGKGNHPVQPNFVDCFSYDVARQFDCPLLYIGNDFAQTDIRGALD